MKSKPKVKNELLLDYSLFLGDDDEGATLRVVILPEDSLQMKAYNPQSEDYEKFLLLLTPDQVEQLIVLWEEWSD